MANTQIQSEQIADDAVTSAKIAANALGINDLSNAVISSSDPLRTTNPTSGVGTLWINSTTGEVYVCIDVTTDSNVWANIGDGAGIIGFEATGGLTQTYTGYKSHTFISSGTFTPIANGIIDVMLVAGGGGGAQDTAGGGGAGGMLIQTSLNVSAQAYSIVIGSGGAQANSSRGYNGNDTTAFGLTAIGGGGGAGSAYAANAGSGGSGGGGAYNYAAGSGTLGQGYDGETASGAAGGGGAGEAGGTDGVGYGGDGATNNYRTGSNITYAGGGGGRSGSTGYPGGDGGGGNGPSGNTGLGAGNAAYAGTVNTGGGGAAYSGAWNGAGPGGSGIVVIRYAF
jgi:hypothetical protein